MTQMKEQIKTPEREISDEKTDNISDAEFKTQVIRMFTEMVEYCCKMKVEMKAIQNGAKENIQGTKIEGKGTRT